MHSPIGIQLDWHERYKLEIDASGKPNILFVLNKFSSSIQTQNIGNMVRGWRYVGACFIFSKYLC